jgi:hypothetical protein
VRIVAGGESGLHHMDVQRWRYYASSVRPPPAEPRPYGLRRARLTAAPPLVAHLESNVPLPVRRMRPSHRQRGGIATTHPADGAARAAPCPADGRSGGKVASYIDRDARGEEYFSGDDARRSVHCGD